MPLLSYALVTMADAALFLKLGNPALTAAETDLVTDLINRATDHCEWYTNRPLKSRAFTDLRFPAQCDPVLRVRATPITTSAAVTITVDTTVQTVWRTEADGDPALKNVIVGADVPGEPSHFWRGTGWCAGSSSNPYPIKMTYTGGLDPIPGHLRDAALLVVESLYRSQEKKTGDHVQAFGPGPVTPSVTYRVELIPMRSKLVLDSYRIHG